MKIYKWNNWTVSFVLKKQKKSIIQIETTVVIKLKTNKQKNKNKTTTTNQPTNEKEFYKDFSF